MTTTMDPHVDLQSLLQEQAQANTPPEDPSSAPPTIPEATATPRPSPAIDDNDIVARPQKNTQNAELSALGKTFGNIPNAPIFTEWDTRRDCSNSAVHRSIIAGICGNPRDGAFSIALSNSYPDDEDGGDIIIYTGSGGRERWTNTTPPRRLRVGPQTKDQSWDDPRNKALIVSFLTGNPVRVIRSWKCESPYAPVKGYRYDGLYRVAAYWTAKGHNGKKICRCRLERLPGQPLIPLRPLTFSTSKRRRKALFVSHITSPSTSSYNILEDTDFDTGDNQPNPTSTQSVVSSGGVSEGVPDSSQQQATPEPFGGIDFNIGEVDPDVKVIQLQPQCPQQSIPPNPGALPRYRWDPKKGQLIKLPASRPILENLGAAGRSEEESREDDALTLVPSEDGHVNMPSNERMETEHFSDRGDSPRPDRDEPHALGFSVWEKQADH